MIVSLSVELSFLSEAAFFWSLLVASVFGGIYVDFFADGPEADVSRGLRLSPAIPYIIV